MCFTLNSAWECAGSIFQVIVEAGANVLVDVLSSPFVWVVPCGCGSDLGRDQSKVDSVASAYRLFAGASCGQAPVLPV